MKRFLTFTILIICISSCAILTEKQVGSISRMAVYSDSLASAPSVIFSKLADVRKERGFFYVATLSSSEKRVEELDAIYYANLADKKLSKKADASISVLESYLRSIKSLSSPTRWEGAGVEIRGLGRNLDSLVIKYNELGWNEEVSEGDIKEISYSVSYLAEQYLKLRQAEVLRNYLPIGDTLIELCTDQLVEVLKDESLVQLIDNEKIGLREDYLSYVELANNNDDRRYLQLLAEIDNIEQIRLKSIRSLQSLKRAHHKIVEQLDRPQEFDVVFDELLELNIQAAELVKLFNMKQDE